MSEVFIIANPCARRATSAGSSSVEALAAALRRRARKVAVRWTGGPGEAPRLTAAAVSSGAKTLVVAGGDGTVNEALQSLIGAGVRLAIWPMGTANVLARTLALPTETERAAAAIVEGRTEKIYPGVAIDERTGARRYFLLMAGVGLDASVVERVRPGLKRRFGELAFWWSGLAHLVDWRPTPFQVEINGAISTATFAAIGRAPRYGGDLAITPGARLNQPEFEVCLVSSESRWRYLQLLYDAMRQRLPESVADFRLVRASEVSARGDAPVQVDGELIGRLPMSFKVVASPVEIIISAAEASSAVRR